MSARPRFSVQLLLLLGGMPNSTPDHEKNRFSARARRYARVGANVGGVAARMAGARFLGIDLDRAKNAAELAAALGGLKGPIMKVAQLLATIPEALPPEYITELTKLQSQAPPMGWAFVKRRMQAELGPDWQEKFASFEHHPAAAASLGQVHRAQSHDGAELACKLQYADMQSAVEADLRQLGLLFAIRRRFDPAIDTSEIIKEIGARMREELDYRREAKHVALYRDMLADEDAVRVPNVWPELSTGRLLDARLARRRPPARTQGRHARRAQPSRQGDVHRLVAAVQPLRRHPRRPASRQLHGLRREGQAGRHQSARLRLHPHLPAELRRRRGRSLQRAARRRRRARRARLRDLGLPQALARTDRHPQHLGALHLRPADGRPRAQHRRRREARRLRPPPGVRGAQGAAAKRAR